MAELTTVLAVHKNAPAQSLEEAKTTEVVMGNSGIGDETYVMPSIANVLLGTKFRFVSGYPGTAAITTAIEKGEVHGRGGSWISWKVLNPHFITEKKIKLLAQGGLSKDPDLPDVPMISDFARNKDDLAVIRLVVALPISISRAIMTPPGVPKDRIQALRRAFDATMADPNLLADAKKRSIAISPSTGEVVESRVAEIMSATPEMIERAKIILGYTKPK
jgi:tripartite-type tricarboxylate transporter receptor subunit TctC